MSDDNEAMEDIEADLAIMEASRYIADRVEQYYRMTVITRYGTCSCAQHTYAQHHYACATSMSKGSNVFF